MLSMLFDFSSGFFSFLNAFFFSFYYSIRFLIGFINAGNGPGNFFICLITQVILIVIIIFIGKGKGFSGFLTFLLCLAVPLLGSFIVIVLLPDNETMRPSSYKSSQNTSKLSYDTSPINISKTKEQKICEKCGQRVNEDLFRCPKCGNDTFKE